MKILNYLASVFLITCSAALAEPSADTGTVLDRFHKAAAEADQHTYLSLLTEDMVFLGTDGEERWQGQQFRDFVIENFSEGRGWRYASGQRNIIVSSDGTTAWFDESLHHETLGPCRGSGVILRTDQGWKIAQYNLSVPVPNEMIEQVAADIAAASTVGGTVPQGTSVQQPATESPTSPDCRKKRHKTNRKAGC